MSDEKAPHGWTFDMGDHWHFSVEPARAPEKRSFNCAEHVNGVFKTRREALESIAAGLRDQRFALSRAIRSADAQIKTAQHRSETK